MIKVLHVVAALDSGGVENLLYQYYKYMNRQRIQFEFIVHHPQKGALEDAFEALGAKIYHIPSKHDSIIKNLQAMRNIIESGHYDIVHSHQDAVSAIPIYFAKKAQTPCRIAHAHNVYFNEGIIAKLINQFLRNILKRNATHYFACSIAAGEWLFKKGFLKKHELVLIKNAINATEFEFNVAKRKAMRKENHLEGKLVIGHVGRFTKQKNHSFLLKVFKELLLLEENAILLLIGDGELRLQIQKEAESLGISKQIRFLGKQTRVADWMQSMDAFVLPSLYEGLGIVLIEAQCAGLGCIASTRVPKEAKLTLGTTFLPLEASYKQWAECILKISKLPRNKESQRIIKAGYDLKEASQVLQSLYEKMLIQKV